MTSISVIIPCHNNGRVLPWILGSISASSIPKNDIEIICVDDASKEDIKPIAQKFGVRYYRLKESEPGRRAMARNKGHQLSHGNITLYLDGDIIPEPIIIRRAIKLHLKHERTVIKYPVYGIPAQIHQESLPTLANLILSHNFAVLGTIVKKHVGIDTRPLPKRLRGTQTNLWILCASHCTSVEKSEIEKVGGWDELFLGWGEEDLELAYRLSKNGLKFLYPHRKHGAAYHLDHPISWEKRLKSLRHNARYFCQKHPEAWIVRQGLLRVFLEENGFSLTDILPNDIVGFND
jgi:glycosyltransferase involved in cell wall biosynthesis